MRQAILAPPATALACWPSARGVERMCSLEAPMRGANLGSPPALVAKADQKRVKQTREYRIITPLFGGGVRPGEADPVTTVRGSTVRGQLRFWWRAARGGHYGKSLAAMKAAEDLLWGAASTAK